jgi:UPF0755 protein
MVYYHSKYGFQKKRKRSPWARFLYLLLTILILAALIIAYFGYGIIFKNNVWVPEGETVSIYIPSNADYEEVKTILYSNGVIVNRNTFEWLAKRKKYPELIKPGHYVISEGMSNDELVNMLRSGDQVPVNVIFNNIRTKPELARRVSDQIEADSLSIISLLNDSVYLSRAGVNMETALTLFIPNTYEFYWNTTAEQFMDRMKRESESFWTQERRSKAAEAGLSQEEVIILASIVEKETNKNDEKARIAGVYKNRLDAGWRLQADPTLVYASGDFGLTRVLNIHKRIDSPYNTYMYMGLPPGPICIPSIASLEAVLNYEQHKYFFFCAKDDLSGYHVFAETVTQHNRNARDYRKAIENRK